MNKNQIRVYHVVQISTLQDNSLSGFHCVPASWVRWQDKESLKVLLAYPDESQEITRQRIENYESPGGYWTLLSAEIQYTIHFNYNVVQCMNEIERPNSSVSLKTSLSSQMSYNNVFWSELQKWLNRQPSFDDPRLSIVNRIHEVISLDSETSDQENVNYGENNIPLDLSSKTVQNSTPRLVQNLKQINNTNETTDDSSTNGGTDKNLTLKHREYAPGLVELIPNTGVYIVEAELDRCLKSSRKCTELARYLTKNIFTKAALRKCLYVDSQSRLEDCQLKSLAIATIVKFSLNYGPVRNWRPSCEKSIRKSICYQMSLLRKSNR